METMQPTLKSGRNTWDQVNMPVEEFHSRVKKLRQRMKEKGIDVLLLYGRAFDEYGNYCYLSNYVIRLPQGALVAVPKTGDLTIIFEGALRGVPSVKKMTWIDDVRATGDVSKECIKYLEEKNLIPSTVGLVGFERLMPYHQLRFILDSLSKCKIINADAILNELRMVKSPLEILQIRRASRIISQTFSFITTTSLHKPREEVLEAEARREARHEGAEDFRMMIAKPHEGKWAFRPPEEIPLKSKDRIIVYLAIEFERYWAEAIRTFNVENSSFVEVKFEEFKNLYEAVSKGMVIDKKISQFYKETMTKIKKANFEFISDYGLGNSIGLSPKEFPVLDEKNRSVFTSGMCFTLRLGVSNQTLGAVMIGDTFYFSKNGPELMTR